MDNTVIQPLEDYIFAGFTKRFQQVFNCPGIITTAVDKTKTLARVFEGKPVTYPYAFLNVQSLGVNTESYNPQSLGRRGLPILVKDEHLNMAAASVARTR